MNTRIVSTSFRSKHEAEGDQCHDQDHHPEQDRFITRRQHQHPRHIDGVLPIGGSSCSVKVGMRNPGTSAGQDRDRVDDRDQQHYEPDSLH